MGAAVANASADFVMLLVDSEGPVAAGIGPWAHLRSRDGWIPPWSVTDDNTHLMVQCMEGWFLADRETLGSYFGAGFRASALPGEATDVERIPKNDALNGLQSAAKGSSKAPS